MSIKYANNYSDLENEYSFKTRMRSKLRDSLVALLSLMSITDKTKEWIRFPYYHHVFDDERANFDRHLQYMKDLGDFISLDDAVEIFKQNKKIGGRYFCVSFDDGFKNCVTNALPLLVKHECPAIFNIPAGCIGPSSHDQKKILDSFFETSSDTYPVPIEFMDWLDCQKLLQEGMLIGSHTYTHLMIGKAPKEKIKEEMQYSKALIEEKLGIECKHFCCPWGRQEKHFHFKDDPQLAKESGYHSFLTAERGFNVVGTDPFLIKRDHLIAKWELSQLRYFFSRG